MKIPVPRSPRANLVLFRSRPRERGLNPTPKNADLISKAPSMKKNNVLLISLLLSVALHAIVAVVLW